MIITQTTIHKAMSSLRKSKPLGSISNPTAQAYLTLATRVALIKPPVKASSTMEQVTHKIFSKCKILSQIRTIRKTQASTHRNWLNLWNIRFKTISLTRTQMEWSYSQRNQDKWCLNPISAKHQSKWLSMDLKSKKWQPSIERTNQYWTIKWGSILHSTIRMQLPQKWGCLRKSRGETRDNTTTITLIKCSQTTTCSNFNRAQLLDLSLIWLKELHIKWLILI